MIETDNNKIYTLSTGESYFSGKNVGGCWDEIGKLQFNYLVSQGLSPEHRMLDIGCGSMRGGVHFASYLNSGNYYGIEKEQWLITAAHEIEIPRYGLVKKSPQLICRDDFDGTSFGVKFDFILAQAVLDHITWNTILRCLVNVRAVLENTGYFYASYLEDPDGMHKVSSICHEPGGIVSYPDRNPYHYEFSVFEDLAQRVDLKVERLGEWGHPRALMMMRFAQKFPEPIAHRKN